MYRADTPYVGGDVFRVAIESGKVVYYKNGTIFYRSTLTPGYPLVGDVAMAITGSAITNASIATQVTSATPSTVTTPPPPTTVTPPPTTTTPPPPTTSTVAPVITNVQVTAITTTTAQVSWNTDIPATSRVTFGTTKTMSRSASDSNLVTGHTFSLTGLKSNTLYYYVVRSEANGKTAYSTRKTFTTATTTTTPPPPTTTPPPPTTQNSKPTGSLDGVDTTKKVVYGWAQDNNTPTTALQVHMYFDANAGTAGATPVACTAGDSRTDVGQHAFNCPVPTQYQNGVPHQVWAWALDTTDPVNNNTQLAGSWKAFTVNTTVTTPPPTTTPPPPTTTPPPPVIQQTVIDGYGDSLAMDGSNFSGWYYDANNLSTTATITYVNTADTTKTYTQQATRTVTRTDAAQYLMSTYGSSLTIAQPLGFNVVPLQVVTIPGTYKISSFKLNNTANSTIQLGTGAQGTFTIPSPTVTPPPTTPPPPVVSGGSSFFGLSDTAMHTPPTTGTYAFNTFKPGTSGFPAVGQSYTDPVFGTTITRLTNNNGAQGDGSLYEVNGYFNADGTKHTAGDLPGVGNAIIDVKTGAVVRALSISGSQLNSSSFDPIDADTFWYWNGASLMKLKVSTGVVTTEKTFPATLENLGGSLDWISTDGDYFLLAWSGQMHIWQRSTNTIFSGAITKTIGGGWASLTSDGNYVVIVDGGSSNGYARYSYTVNKTTKTLSTTGVMFWNESSDDHSDIVSASNGKDYLILFENNYTAGIYAVDVSQDMAGKTPDQQRAANKLLVPLDWSVQSDGHFSCVARGPMRDWCVISTVSTVDTFDSQPSPWYAFKQEIFAVNALTGEVRRFAHHRSRSVGMQSYYRFPRANVNWDGTEIIFASNFNSQNGTNYSDLYRIDIR